VSELVDGKWPRRAVGDLLESIIDYRGKTPPKSESGIPLISAANVKAGRVEMDDPEFISLPDYEKWTTRGFTQPGDVLITTEAPAGEVAPYPRLGTYQISRRVMALRPRRRKLDSGFLLYALLWSEVKQRLLSCTRGTTVPRVLKTDITGLEIPYPSLREQKAIAHILGTLDDKIELNRRMNETLEAMARAIFKSWFVDFDPIRAKVDGRQPPGMDPDTAALFPDSFEESEIGQIPRGWNTPQVGETIKAVGGGTPSTKEPTFWEGGTHHWATPKDLSQLQSPILLDTARKITDAGVAAISSGLLPRGTLLLSSRAPVGYLAISEVPVAVNQGFIAMICSERASNLFMLNWCRENMDEIERRASGTTFQEISKTNFRPIPMVLPPVELVSVFTDAVTPHFGRIAVNLHECQTLAAIRDALLPKLLSGEIRIKDAKKFAEGTL